MFQVYFVHSKSLVMFLTRMLFAAPEGLPLLLILLVILLFVFWGKNQVDRGLSNKKNKTDLKLKI
jgi:hypothetical protein